MLRLCHIYSQEETPQSFAKGLSSKNRPTKGRRNLTGYSCSIAVLIPTALAVVARRKHIQAGLLHYFKFTP